MRIKTNVKAGKIAINHNQAVKLLRVKSNIKAGIYICRAEVCKCL